MVVSEMSAMQDRFRRPAATSAVMGLLLLACLLFAASAAWQADAAPAPPSATEPGMWADDSSSEQLSTPPRAASGWGDHLPSLLAPGVAIAVPLRYVFVRGAEPVGAQLPEGRRVAGSRAPPVA